MEKAIRTNSIEARGLMRLLTGMVIGGIVGYGATLLLAPQSGEKTRIQIGEKGIELQDRATDTYNELVTLSQYDNRKILIRTQR